VNAVLYDVALTAYILAAVAAIGSLFGRRDQLAWIGLLLTQAGWICHTAAVIARGIELGRLPFMTMPEVISLVIWAAVLLDQALLAEGGQLDDPAAFVRRINQLMLEMSGSASRIILPG